MQNAEIAEIQVNHIYLSKYSKGKVFFYQPVYRYGLRKLEITAYLIIVLILAEEILWKIKINRMSVFQLL